MSIRRARAQRADPAIGPIAVIKREEGAKRLPLSDPAAVAETVDAIIDERIEEVWLTDREWFHERLGQRIVPLERAVAETAANHGYRLVAWTDAAQPTRTEVYEAVKGAPPSTSPALDRVDE